MLYILYNQNLNLKNMHKDSHDRENTGTPSEDYIKECLTTAVAKNNDVRHVSRGGLNII